MTNRHSLSVFVLLACFLAVAASNPLLPPASAQTSSSLAKTPPMGWNSWNKFGCNVSDKLIHEMADAMISSGMQAAGYQYVNMTIAGR